MPKQTKVCRVCGKTYESCRSIKTGSGVFNWREICCSPECGATYFKRVDEARHGLRNPPQEENGHTEVETTAETTVETSVETEQPSEVVTENEEPFEAFTESEIEEYLDQDDVEV